MFKNQLNKIRYLVLESCFNIKEGHVGSAFSVLETGAIFEGVGPETDTTAFTLHNGSTSSITYSTHKWRTYNINK